MSNQLNGKVALVTGGSRGIGAAISRTLAKQGATVLVNYAKSESAARKLADEIKAAGGRAAAIGGDVSDPSAVKKLFEQIDKTHGGRVDILVNNAGVYLATTFEDASDENYRKTMATNVDAAYYVTHEAVKRMGTGGRIITMGSVLGERAMGPGVSAYTASKFAVAGLARSWAHDLAKRGITSNVVQPGPIDTDMNPADSSKNPGADGMRQSVPLGRYGKADEVAAVVAFLASSQSGYVNGAAINIDGGMNA